MAAGLLHEAVHHAQPEPAAGAWALGGEERLEYPLPDLGRHAGPGIRDGQGDIGARLQFGRLTFHRHQPGVDDEMAALGHGVARVDRQVQQGVLDLTRIGHHHRDARSQPRLDADLLAQAAAQQVDHAVDQGVQVDRLGVQGLPPPEGEQAAGELGAERRRLLGLLQNLAVVGVGHTPLQQFQIAGDHRQQVVEVVRDAAGQLADRLHLLGLAQLLLHALARRDVADEAGEDLLARKHYLADRELDREDRAVLALRLHRPADSDDPLLAGPQIAFEVAVMGLGIGRGHQHVDVPADDLACGIAEQALGRVAEGLHDALGVDRDDGVGGGIQDRAKPGLPFLDHGLGTLRLGYLADEPQHRNRLPFGIVVHHPVALDDHPVAVAVPVDQFAPPLAAGVKLGLDDLARSVKDGVE